MRYSPSATQHFRRRFAEICFTSCRISREASISPPLFCTVNFWSDSVVGRPKIVETITCIAFVEKRTHIAKINSCPSMMSRRLCRISPSLFEKCIKIEICKFLAQKFLFPFFVCCDKQRRVIFSMD